MLKRLAVLLPILCGWTGAVDTLTVVGSRIPRAFSELTRSVSVITAGEIADLPVKSIADVLDYAVGADIQRRGDWGMQADVTLRGATFEQVLVLVDGIRANDPQTGHHTMDLPVSLAAVERIEVLHGAGSSVYGPDAFGGVINIVTKAAVRNGAAGTLRWAEYGTVIAGGTWRMKNGRAENVLSGEWNRSDGYRYDTDFTHYGISDKLIWRHAGGHTTLGGGLHRKEFGAYRFYSTAIEDDREWTGTLNAHLQTETRLTERLRLHAGMDAKRHDDRYQYRWGTVTYADTHHTETYHAEVQAAAGLGTAGKVLAGADLHQDRIVSTNMGDHWQQRAAGYAEYSNLLAGQLMADAGLRLDYHTGWATVLSPSLAIGYWPAAFWKFRMSVSRGFRAPTFTELHYTNPGNRGSNGLVPEKCWSYEAGADFLPDGPKRGGVTLFLRRQTDVIDWIKSDVSDPVWRAVNIGRLDVWGGEVSGRWTTDKLDVYGTYAFTSRLQDHQTYVSKYALRYARHQAAVRTAYSAFFKLRPAVSVRYTGRDDEKGVLLVDARIGRELPAGMRLYMEGTNLFDTDYEEIPGVPRPGRMFGAGLVARM